MKFHRNLPGQRIGRLRSYPWSTKSPEAEWGKNSLLDSEQNGLSDFPELYGENSRFIQFVVFPFLEQSTVSLNPLVKKPEGHCAE